MEMEDQYGISDLRQFISRATVPQFPYNPQPPSLPSSSDLFSAHHHHHRGLSPPAAASQQQQQQQYEMVVMGRNMSAAVAAATAADMLHHNTATGFLHHHKEPHPYSDSTTTTATAVAAAAAAATNSGGFDAADGGAARWPRQETLTLLEIRSRLDHKFKEANQKGPLWDEVARIMSEEHGYQRSGKKCREKFENLYKYYKKTKEGKAGRQDGKHYRFFRQLEALYGDQHNTHHIHHPTTSDNTHHIAGNVPHFHNNPNIITSKLGNTDNHPILRPTSVSLSNSSDYETSSSDNDVGGSIESDEWKKKKKKGKRSWKAKVKEFIDYQMRKIMEKQEAWLEKMMKTLDSRERERMEREEEWRKQEGERIEREHKFWASERAWIEARDSALMTALEKMTNSREKEASVVVGDCHHHRDRDRDHYHGRVGIIANDQWLETEVTRLIQLRTSMESRFQQCGFSEEVLWEDIAAKMAYLGYDRSAIVCKEKWDSINNIIKDEGNKKRKENYGEVSNHHNFHNHNHNHNHNEGGGLYINQMGGHTHGFSNNCEINEPRLQLNEESSSPSSHNSNANVNVNVSVNGSVAAGGSGSVINDNCLRFFLGDADQTGLGWETNYGMKLNKGGD